MHEGLIEAGLSRSLFLGVCVLRACREEGPPSLNRELPGAGRPVACFMLPG